MRIKQVGSLGKHKKKYTRKIRYVNEEKVQEDLRNK